MSLNRETGGRGKLKRVHATASDESVYQRLNLWPSPLHPRRSQLNLNRIYQNTVFLQPAGNGPISERASKTRKEPAPKARTPIMRARSPPPDFPGSPTAGPSPPTDRPSFKKGLHKHRREELSPAEG
jgi:hypothetical protein